MDMQALVKKATAIFSLPDVVIRVNDLIESGDASNQELEQLLCNDSGLTAKLLKFANSPYFGFSGKISNVSNAISIIGHKELRNLVVASTVTSTFKGIPAELIDMDRFWYYSVTSGVVSRLLSTSLQNRERFFIAGLLHCVGRLILLSQYPEESVKILNLVSEGEEAVIAAEKENFGFTHAQLGAALLKEWKLPENIWGIVEHYSDPSQDETSKVEVSILYAAVQIANHIQPCINRYKVLPVEELIEKMENWGYFGLTPEVIDSTVTVAKLHVIEVLNAIRN